MNGLLLVLTVLGISTQHVAKKTYNTRVSNGALTFSATSALFACIVFVFLSQGFFVLNSEVLPYSLLFAATYAMGLVFSVLAIKEGPLSLTCLITQYSLLIPTFHGLLFLNEPYKSTLFVGIILFISSVILVNCEKKDSKKITPKWALYTFLAFFGNGVCSTVQKVAGLNLRQEYKSSFMICAFLITSICLFALSFIKSGNDTLLHLKKGFLPSLVCGIANGMVNVFTLTLATRMSASLAFPIIASGGIVLTALVSILVYREKLSLFQKLGFVLGVLSIVTISI